MWVQFESVYNSRAGSNHASTEHFVSFHSYMAIFYSKQLNLQIKNFYSAIKCPQTRCMTLTFLNLLRSNSFTFCIGRKRIFGGRMNKVQIWCWIKSTRILIHEFSLHHWSLEPKHKVLLNYPKENIFGSLHLILYVHILTLF